VGGVGVVVVVGVGVASYDHRTCVLHCHGAARAGVHEHSAPSEIVFSDFKLT
jgi:hypothetical protein